MSGRAIEYAANVELIYCESPLCRAVHLILRDSNDQPFAVGTIPEDQVPQVLAKLQERPKPQKLAVVEGDTPG